MREREREREREIPKRTNSNFLITMKDLFSVRDIYIYICGRVARMCVSFEGFLGFDFRLVQAKTTLRHYIKKPSHVEIGSTVYRLHPSDSHMSSLMIDQWPLLLKIKPVASYIMHTRNPSDIMKILKFGLK